MSKTATKLESSIELVGNLIYERLEILLWLAQSAMQSLENGETYRARADQLHTLPPEEPIELIHTYTETKRRTNAELKLRTQPFKK